MHKNLSKSVGIMFLFDVLALICSSWGFYKFFNLDSRYLFLIGGLVVVAGLVTLFLKDNYKIREFNITLKNAYLLFEGCVFTMFPVAILLYILTSGINIVYFVLSTLFSVWFLLFVYRMLFHYYLFNLKTVKKVLIVCDGKKQEIIKDIIEKKYALKMEVVSPSSDGDISRIVETENVDIIVFQDDENSKKAFPKLKNCKKLSFYEFYESALRKSYVDDFSAQELENEFSCNKFLGYRFCKRVYDIIAATIILTVTFPILLYIGLRVKLTDGGEVIYTQNRVGRGGKIFKAYKIRTMYANDYKPTESNIDKADDQNNDDRVIPFCKWIRKARLDEIPQMINILKGEMSIVGPRAEWEELVNIYKNQIKYYHLREIVKTGWTGWAQINQGHCISEADIREKLEYDVYYIKHRNILWEIGILVKAVFLALGGRHG